MQQLFLKIKFYAIILPFYDKISKNYCKRFPYFYQINLIDKYVLNRFSHFKLSNY